MLVVTRKTSESILIGEDIEVKIIALDNGTVKIGIEAPKQINVVRKEILKDIENENREATKFDLKSFENLKIK